MTAPPAWDRRTCVRGRRGGDAGHQDLRAADAAGGERQGKGWCWSATTRQLASIERGGMFTAVKEQHGSAVISKVRRQEADWQRAALGGFCQMGRSPRACAPMPSMTCLVWSDSLDEARTRLLSDWDWDSRERPAVNRFVYASTNAEVNRLNQDIREIRKRRGEVGEGLTVETTRGRVRIRGGGPACSSSPMTARAGFYNGTLGTVDVGRRPCPLPSRPITAGRCGVDTAEFKQFGLGYAGTVYRGQGEDPDRGLRALRQRLQLECPHRLLSA